MSFLTSISNLLVRHEHDLNEVAEYEANSQMLKLSLQLNRLRTVREQLDLLTSYYNQTLESLKELDESGAYQLPLMIELLPHSGMSMEQVSQVTDKFGGFIGLTGQLEQIDFSQIDGLPLNAIPTDHPVHGILKAYKDYLSLQGFLEKIVELMDWAEAHQNGDKLSPEEVKEVKDEKVMHLTAAQKVLALYNLMRWAGIELGDRQGARQHRFIAALTGIASGTVKEKFPSATTADKPYHIENLKALVTLFESINATNLVEKIQSAIQFEQEETRD